MTSFLFIVQIPTEQRSDGPEKKITRLAIGVEGGCTADSDKPKFTTHDDYKVVVLPDYEPIAYPNDQLPNQVAENLSFFFVFLFA